MGKSKIIFWKINNEVWICSKGFGGWMCRYPTLNFYITSIIKEMSPLTPLESQTKKASVVEMRSKSRIIGTSMPWYYSFCFEGLLRFIIISTLDLFMTTKDPYEIFNVKCIDKAFQKRFFFNSGTSFAFFVLLRLMKHTWSFPLTYT